MHRGPYTRETNGTVTCERLYGEQWIPFSAMIDDDDTADAAIAEDIYNAWQRGEITIVDTPQIAPPVENTKLTPVQFRRGLRAMGIRDQFQHFIDADPIASDEFEYATVIERFDSQVERLFETLDADIDLFFQQSKVL